MFTPRKFALLAGTALLLLQSNNALAERLLDENFEYNSGGLYNQGSWIRYGTNTGEPIQLVTPGLTYPGYQDEAKGYSVKLIGSKENVPHEKLQKAFSDNDNSVISGDVYMAALVNFSKVPSGDVYFLNMCQRVSAGFLDGKTGSDIPRIFASTDTDGKLYLGVSKNTGSPQAKSAPIELNKTYLVVLKYTFIDGTNNDKLCLYINPAKDKEPVADALVADASKADVSTKYGLQGVVLRQGSTTSKIGPDVLIDAVRVATSWDELWDGNGGGDNPEPPVGKATITVPAELSFGSMLQYSSTTASINVKATGLTGDIIVSSTSSDVKPSVTTIPMDVAMSAEGYTLTLSYKANSATLSGNLSFAAEGAETVSTTLSSEVTPVTPFANFKQVSGFSQENIYYFQGKATVTHIDGTNSKLYCQDIYGGGAVFDLSMLSNALTLKVGDRFTNTYCFPGETSLGITPLCMLDLVAPKVTSSNVTVEPLEITLDELSRDAETYANRLVKVLDVDFGEAAGNNFTTSGVAVTTTTGSGRVRAFATTDVLGTAIPAKAKSVTGISTSATSAIVTMRSLADLVPEEVQADEPTLEYTTETLINASEYQEVNKTVDFGTITVKYANLTKSVSVWLRGTNRNMFAIDTEEIPAGTGTAVIKVTYTPTSTGRHTANVVLDATPVELSQSIAIAARAYDPAVTPTITVDDSALTEFEAAVNGTHEQTITYTTENLLDYGSIKVTGNSGTFIISSASMLTNGQYSLKISFKPKSEGKFTDTIVFSADKAESVSVQVSGHTTGSAPVEEKEGDEFTMAAFDTTNAHALLKEDFQNLGAATNKPFHLNQWTNTALTGTRAWWAYNELNTDNWTAKVTAYDSKATESSDAQMLLISPCLDFVNAAQPLLTFRVMGKFMTDAMFDNLQVLYIDPTDASAQSLTAKAVATASSPLDNVWAEEFTGIGIPVGSDANNSWYDFVIDLKGMPIADKFFIAFGYTSVRGKDTSTTYLLDDFTWGRGDIPFIRPSHRELSIDGTINNETISEEVTVEGLNLSKPISLKMTGAHASNFTVEPAELPAEGGTFKVHFNSENAGAHEAYVSLSSEGSPEALIAVKANNDSSAVDAIGIDSDVKVNVYNLQGIQIKSDVELKDATKGLPKGIYIVNGKKVYVK